MSIEMIKAACDLCGVDECEYSNNPNALSDLANLYLQMQIAADIVASSDDFNPRNPDAYNKDGLESQFPTKAVKKIILLAVLQVLSFEDMPLSEFADLGKTGLQ